MYSVVKRKYLACHARLNPHTLSRSLPEAKNSCQPVTIKNRDKIHEKVGFLVKNRDIVKKSMLRD